MSLNVVNYFANDEGGVYGDIYTDMAELREDHPDAPVLTGYGVHDTETGYSPADAADWYWTVAEAQAYIDAQKRDAPPK